MIDNPIFQILGGLGVFVGGILVTMLGLKGRNDTPDSEQSTSIVKETQELTNRISHLENRLQRQAKEFGSHENDLEERISKLENNLQQKDALLQEKDKSLEESRSVNAIMADNAKNMSERMTKIEAQMETLQKKYEEKVAALTEREKLISELETQLKIQQASIELLKDVSTRPVVIHLVNGDNEKTYTTEDKKVDTSEVSNGKENQESSGKLSGSGGVSATGTAKPDPKRND